MRIMRIMRITPDTAHSKPAEALSLKDPAKPFTRNAVPVDEGKARARRQPVGAPPVRGHAALIARNPVPSLGISGAERRLELGKQEWLRAAATELFRRTDHKTDIRFTASDPDGTMCRLVVVGGTKSRPTLAIQDIGSHEGTLMLTMYQDPHAGAPHLKWTDPRTGMTVVGRNLRGDNLNRATALIKDALRATPKKAEK